MDLSWSCSVQQYDDCAVLLKSAVGSVQAGACLLAQRSFLLVRSMVHRKTRLLTYMLHSASHPCAPNDLLHTVVLVLYSMYVQSTSCALPSLVDHGHGPFLTLRLNRPLHAA